MQPCSQAISQLLMRVVMVLQ